jgi:hypothetical protein
MKELDIEVEDNLRDEVSQLVENALTNESVLWLIDRKGRRVGVPSSRIAYVEFGVPASERRVGFGAI